MIACARIEHFIAWMNHVLVVGASAHLDIVTGFGYGCLPDRVMHVYLVGAFTNVPQHVDLALC